MVIPNLGVKTPTRSHKINLRGPPVINEINLKKQVVSMLFYNQVQ